jgi:radical SAM superfamily enzyme YgiQ (UPF0313 family)
LKVVLVNPSVNLVRSMGLFRRALTPVAPLGIAYLAAVLEREQIPVKIIDQFAEGISSQELALRIIGLQADVVGFSVLTPNIRSVTETIAELDRIGGKHRPKVVAGNIHPTIFYREMLEGKIADYVVIGEGEKTFLELVKALDAADEQRIATIPGLAFMSGGEVKINKRAEQIRDLDSLPFPAWHLFDLNHYKAPPTLALGKVILPTLLRRGCPFSCTFCSQNINYKKVLGRSYDNLLDEVEDNIARYGIRYFGLQDASFPMSENDALEFADALMSRGLHHKVSWMTEARVDQVTQKSLKMLRKSGCYLIQYGYESGDQGVLDSIKKRFTVEQARQATAYTHEAGIFIYGLFIIGLPGETPETIEKTIRFAIELSPETAKFNRFTPYPGSELYDLLMKDSDFDFEKLTPWAAFDEDEGLPFVPEGMTAKQLVQLQTRGVLRYYLRPKIMAQFMRNNLMDPKAVGTAFKTAISAIAGAK